MRLNVLRPAAALIAAFVLISPTDPVAARDKTRRASADDLTPRLEVMLRSLRIAREWHVGRPTKSQLLTGAVQGMLTKLDPEAEYYTRAELNRISRARNQGDVGLIVRREPDQRRRPSPGYRVISTLDGSPAAIAGIKAGDLVTAVNGQRTADMRYLELTRLVIAGEPGTAVDMTLEQQTREGDGGGTTAGASQRTVTLVRTLPARTAVAVAEPEPGVIWLKVSSVVPEAAEAASHETAAALRQLEARARGLVLDLRGTAEGTSDGVVALADLFLNSGPLLNEEARNERPGPEPVATPGDIANGLPLTVLVDGATAGPAEALAAALKDNHRARIVGEKSAGRGAVRTVRGLGHRGQKGAIRMTTLRLKTPAGEAIEGKGIVPDLVVAQSPADPACRGTDIRDAAKPGSCRRREAAQDAQLQRAMAVLGGTVAAGPRLHMVSPAAAQALRRGTPEIGTR